MSANLIKLTNCSIITNENWEDKKQKLKLQFPNLSDTDLTFDESKISEMIDNIHTKVGNIIGKTKEELHKFIESL